MIPADDRGLTLGDGLFETVLAVAGAFARLDAHLDRMAAGCTVIGLPAPDPQAVASEMRRALAMAGLEEARAAVRVSYTAGSGGRGLDRPARPAPRLSVTAAAAPKPVTPARLALSGVRRNDQSPASRLKTLAYLDNVLARAEALGRGADEALMLNTRGEAACAAAGNLFWLVGTRLFTPALDCGVLAGVTRAVVLEAAPALGLTPTETHVGPEALAQAEAIFVTNSLIGVRSVSDYEGRTIAISDVARRLDDLVS